MAVARMRFVWTLLAVAAATVVLTLWIAAQPHLAAPVHQPAAATLPQFPHPEGSHHAAARTPLLRDRAGGSGSSISMVSKRGREEGPGGLSVTAPSSGGTVGSAQVSSLRLVLVVTLAPSDPTSEKWAIQLAALQCLRMLEPAVHVIVANSEPKSLAMATVAKVDSVKLTTRQHNSAGTPYLRSLLKIAEEHADAPFIGYANADLLFQDGLIEMLDAVQWMKTSQLRDKILMVGTRANVELATSQKNWHALKDVCRDSNAQRYPSLFKSFAGSSQPFSGWAIDYFFMVPGTLDWTDPSLPDYVVGRVGFDNYVVHWAVEHNDTVSTIDVSSALTVVHQTGNDGNFAGHTMRQDHSFNHLAAKKVGAGYQRGKVSNCVWELTRVAKELPFRLVKKHP